MTMYENTFEMCSELMKEYDTVPKEAVFAEWWKWATKSEEPSWGLDVLLGSWWIELYPELVNLPATMQDENYHPEGNVWEHTKYAVDAAAEIAIREHLSRGRQRYPGHGSPAARRSKTSHHDLQARSHRLAWSRQRREELRQSFLGSIGFPFTKNGPSLLTEKIIRLVECHMRHLNPLRARVPYGSRRDVYPARLDMLVCLMEADYSARPPLKGGMPEGAQILKDFALLANVEEKPVPPILMGRHLVSLGMKEGPAIGSILKMAYEAQLEEYFFDYDGGIKWVKLQLKELK